MGYALRKIKLTQQPIIQSERLILRKFLIEDAPVVQNLVNDKRIAEPTENIPHPYPDGLADEWINSHQQKWEEGKLASFAITLKSNQMLMGAISLMNMDLSEGELGYWIGVKYWNQGYCTEACKSLIKFGFSHLKLSRIYAHHLSSNSASGKVLLKSGLAHCGQGSILWRKTEKVEKMEQYEIKSA